MNMCYNHHVIKQIINLIEISMRFRDIAEGAGQV